jgi:endogenous inhibitor of DNA gyrase (YacG/DUF329 family)
MLCPICKKPVPESPADRPKSDPFCSERCKLIDLGRWLRGAYQVPASQSDPDEAETPPPEDE